MSLSPLDIQNKTFEHKMRGYNMDEVDDFLDQVVRDYEDLKQKNHDLEKNLKHATEKLNYFEELKNSLNQSIIVAQDTAEKVKANAKNEAKLQVEKAKNKAEKIVANAQTDAMKIFEDTLNKTRDLCKDTEELKHAARTFHQRISLMLESELKTINSEEWNELLAPLSPKLPSSEELLNKIVEKTETTNSTTNEQTKQTDLKQPDLLKETPKKTNPNGKPISIIFNESKMPIKDLPKNAKEEKHENEKEMVR